MPIENERKYVLDDLSGALESRVAAMPGVKRTYLRQAYLEAPGLRIRSIEAVERTQYIFTYKRSVADQMVEIETEMSRIDFERLWTLRRETLEKARYAWTDGRFHWDVDFFNTDDGATYFAMAEVEMPEDEATPPPPPAILAPHVLLLAPRNDARFTSKRIADRQHAEGLLAEILKGKAA